MEKSVTVSGKGLIVPYEVTERTVRRIILQTAVNYHTVYHHVRKRQQCAHFQTVGRLLQCDTHRVRVDRYPTAVQVAHETETPENTVNGSDSIRSSACRTRSRSTRTLPL